MNHHRWLWIGALLGALGVAFGAFGAHGLSEWLSTREANATPRLLETFETAARYQMYHALALVAVGLAAAQRTGIAFEVAGWAFLIGIALFSGSLYVLVLTGERWLGAITPLGGVAFIVGWVALAVGAGRSAPSSAANCAGHNAD